MAAKERDYDLIATLHDQLEDIESYERYLKDADDCEGCTRIWTLLKQRAEEVVTMIRAEIQRHGER